MPELAFLLTAFTSLFVIIDPIGLAPIFLALTRGMDRKLRRRIAIRACATGSGVLFLFALFGEQILEFIGISMSAFQIAGGILLFLTALDMLFERRNTRREDRAEEADEEHDDPSVFPLGIPLLAGPGAITTVILLAGEVEDTAGFIFIIAIMVIVVGLSFLMFLLANPIERILGRTGILVITRVFGMLLAALAVQFTLDGVTGFFVPPPELRISPSGL